MVSRGLQESSLAVLTVQSLWPAILPLGMDPKEILTGGTRRRLFGATHLWNCSTMCAISKPIMGEQMLKCVEVSMEQDAQSTYGVDTE